MRILIAVKSCHKNAARRAAQRATWVRDVPACADLRFFLGGGRNTESDGDVHLDCPDTYEGLPEKTRRICEWARRREYDHVFMTDDDVYVQPNRLLSAGFHSWDYSGRVRGPMHGFPAPYCSGFSYWLSGRALGIVAELARPDLHGYEDCMVGNTLHEHGVDPHPDYRYVITRSDRNAVSGREGPRIGNDVISEGEVEPWRMQNVHDMWLHTPSAVISSAAPSKPFSEVAVMVKTFLRDGYLRDCVDSIEKGLPGAQVMVVDDGRESKQKVTWYSELRSRGHVTLWMEFDSGFCRKSNAAVEALDRPLMLIASDDFDMSGQQVRRGVERMMSVLRSRPDVGVASGNVDGVPYEGHIEWDGDEIREVRIDPEKYEKLEDGTEYQVCDLTVNYNLVRREVFRPEDGSGGVRWPPHFKIGGDHFHFYSAVAAAGWKVAHVRGANVNQMRYDVRKQDPTYITYRGRALQSLPRMFADLGIKRYVGFDGRIDWIDGSGVARSTMPARRSDEPISVTGTVTKRKSNHPALPDEEVFIPDQALYYSSVPGEVVGESSSRRRGLLCMRGGAILLSTARKLGLTS